MSKSKKKASIGPIVTPIVDDSDLIEGRTSGVHGQGAFAKVGLRKGQTLGMYTGRIYAPGEEAEHDWDNKLTYVFGLTDGSYIDGGQGGNATRLLNHSCAPNCQAFELTDENGALSVVVEAKRRIVAGSELFIDYALDIGEDDPADYPCRCGAPECRGTMAAPPAKPAKVVKKAAAKKKSKVAVERKRSTARV